MFTKDFFVPVKNHQVLVRLLQRAETELDFPPIRPGVEYAGGRGRHHGTDLLVREPELAPAVRGVSGEELVVVLVEKPSRLWFEVRAIAVGEQVLPDRAIARERPAEELLARHFFVQRPMAIAELRVVPIGAVGFLELAVDEVAAAFVRFAMIFI